MVSTRKISCQDLPEVARTCIIVYPPPLRPQKHWRESCLLYTSGAAGDMQCVDLGGRRIIKKKIFFKQKTAYEM